jgi:hypothetical protein
LRAEEVSQMAVPPTTNTHDERRWSFGAWLTLVFVVALLGLSIGQVVYRMLLPTEGWNFSIGETTDDFQANTLIFTANLLGPPSPIQVGDRLIAVEGRSIDQVQTMAGPVMSDGWQAGQIVQFTVQRDGQFVELAIPLKHWTIAGIRKYVFRDFNAIASSASALLMFTIGLFVMLKRPDEPAARALLLLTAGFLSMSTNILPDGPTTQLSAVWPVTAALRYWIFAFLIGPTLFVLSLTFPRPKYVLRRAPWLVVLPYTVFWALVAMFGVVPQMGYVLTGGFCLLSLLSAIHSALTQRNAVSRAQLRWGLGGLIAAILLFLPDILLAVGVINGSQVLWLYAVAILLSNLSLLVFISCLTVAILRYRLWDIDIIIRRTLVYSVLTLTLGLVYIGCIVVSRTLAAPYIGGSEPAIVISTLVIAALFMPLRRRIQNLIDRRFYRRKYDATKVLAAFGATARDETDLDALTNEMLRVVDTTMQPEFVGLWLRDTQMGNTPKSTSSNSTQTR